MSRLVPVYQIVAALRGALVVIAALILVLALMGRRMGQLSKVERQDRERIGQLEAQYQVVAAHERIVR